ncbi:DNA ligase III [Hyphomicrobiales bacterium]|jgi:hypothetical protein|nr:DNA ligase III [Hyphomicrobiales bacterium]CAH1702556.1 RNA_ligase domain-containing protein [Hyphomicrobiales bacterium]CAI0346758.1 DNA ligase III [Hyphomicrobiales bacterium]
MYTPPRPPRTQHLRGSKAAKGESARDQISVTSLRDGDLVFEEKLDGGEVGIYQNEGNLLLRHRGTVLGGHSREPQFDLLKVWAAVHDGWLRDLVGERYVVYCEWLHRVHCAYYDLLPHFLFEYDVYDRETGRYLATDERHALLDGAPMPSVPVVHRGHLKADAEIQQLIQPSLFKSSDWQRSLAEQCVAAGVAASDAATWIDMTSLPEGLYVKHEVDGCVVGRYKWIRAEFLATITSGAHWSQRPALENGLAPGIDILAAPYSGVALRG